MRAIIVLATLLVATGTAGSAEIKALVSTAMKAPFEEIGAQFEKETGHKIIAAYGPSGALTERVANGEAADLAIIGGSGVGRLIDQGKIGAGTVGVARSMIGAAVRAGARKPDISTEEKFKAVLIEAKSVAYTDAASGGSSGVFLGKLFDRIGLTETLKPKARLAAGGPNGYAATFVANGEAEIAMQPIPELMAVPGVDIVGPLPGIFQNATIYYAAIPTDAKEPEAARALRLALRKAAAREIITAKGLEPSFAMLMKIQQDSGGKSQDGR